MKTLALPLLFALSSTFAAAQSFNVDVGPNLILAPAPDASYGAAAGQTGHWTAFKDPFTVTPLEGLGGGATGVTLMSDSSSGLTLYPSVLPPGGDQALLEDAQWLPNLATDVTWTFLGLQPGEYTLYTYAISVKEAGTKALITVPASSDPAQVVGGAWPGSHQFGVSYARHAVTVTDGSLVVVAQGQGPQGLDSALLNGFQLVFGEVGDDIGTNYCGPANLNSTGQSAVISAVGSDQVADNDVTLKAEAMPLNQFGYFLVSLDQGFVANPGGSQGNLCLGGSIGRYTQQVKSTGATGSFELAIDLAAIPQPGGSVVVQPGETWNFQSWYRDVNPMPTSNFTDGLEIPFF